MTGGRWAGPAALPRGIQRARSSACTTAAGEGRSRAGPRSSSCRRGAGTRRRPTRAGERGPTARRRRSPDPPDRPARNGRERRDGGRSGPRRRLDRCDRRRRRAGWRPSPACRGSPPIGLGLGGLLAGGRHRRRGADRRPGRCGRRPSGAGPSCASSAPSRHSRTRGSARAGEPATVGCPTAGWRAAGSCCRPRRWPRSGRSR